MNSGSGLVPDKKWLIYVLELEGGRYYVGKTTSPNLQTRLNSHIKRDKKSALWTKIYKVKKVRKDLFLNDVSSFQEDKVVKEMMYTYGIDKVRGGSYSRFQLTPQQVEFIMKQMYGATDLCYRCKKYGHFIKHCHQNQQNIKEANVEKTHSQSGFFKKTQQKKVPFIDFSKPFSPIKQTQKKISPPSQPPNLTPPVIIQQPSQPKNNFSFLPYCSTCKLYGHETSGCDLQKFGQKFKDNFSKKLNHIKCYRCHNKGHYANQCPYQIVYDNFYDSDYYSDWQSQSEEQPYFQPPRQTTNQRRNTGFRCYQCGDPNHLRPDCPFNKQTFSKGFHKNTGMRCYRCGNPNHLRPDCPQESDDDSQNF